MGKILQKKFRKELALTFYPDPYPEQTIIFIDLNNATPRKMGVPAHTISTSKMDSEPNYHKLSDQIETLDMRIRDDPQIHCHELKKLSWPEKIRRRELKIEELR
jgi:hypothetical protein